MISCRLRNSPLVSWFCAAHIASKSSVPLGNLHTWCTAIFSKDERRPELTCMRANMQRICRREHGLGKTRNYKQDITKLLKRSALPLSTHTGKNDNKRIRYASKQPVYTQRREIGLHMKALCIKRPAQLNSLSHRHTNTHTHKLTH